jgi:HEAT repeat protein
MRRLLWGAAVGLVVLASGCGESRPVTAGGKPVDYWLQTLQDPDPRARKKAATKLGNVGSVDPSVVPALAEALKDSDAGVQAEAALALSRIGPAAHEAVPALTEAAQKGKDARVRTCATVALEKIQGG